MACGCKKKQIIPQAPPPPPPPPSQPSQPSNTGTNGTKVVLKENISVRPPMSVDPSVMHVNKIIKKLDAIRARQLTNRRFS